MNGIGDAYAETLNAAGIHTTAQLASADPQSLAETTGIPQTRIEKWQSR